MSDDYVEVGKKEDGAVRSVLGDAFKRLIPDFDGDIFSVLVAAILLVDCDEDELPIILLLILLSGL